MMQGGENRLNLLRRAIGSHLAAILAYAILALALTWPLAASLGWAVPGNGADDPPLTWNLWWVRHSILEVGANPFDCDYLFYPLGINLAYYTLTLLNGFLSIPLQAALGLVRASNLLLLSSFVLAGYGAYLLALYILRQVPAGAGRSGGQEAGGRQPVWAAHAAALGGGLLYAFASSKLFYAALGQWNIASSQWIPFFVLYLFKTAERPRTWRYPALASLFLLFQAYAELTYATFLVLFSALWLGWRCASEIARAGRQGVRRVILWVPGLALMGALFLLGLAPMLSQMIPDMMAEGSFLVEGSGFAEAFSADLLGFLVPTMHHPVFGGLVERFSFDHTVGQHLYLGYAVMALAIIAAVAGWRGRAAGRAPASGSHEPAQGSAVRAGAGGVGFWALSALVFWLFTLGPRLRINGQSTQVPLPFAVISKLPFFEGNRYPSRYSVVLLLSLAMLVAFGLLALLRHAGSQAGSAGAGLTGEPQGGRTAHGQRVAAHLVAILLIALMLFEHLSAPLPLSDMRVPEIYRAVAGMPGDWTLLDLPVAWRNGFRITGTPDTIIMFEQFYQTAHGKRILAGNTSRNPPLKFQYFSEAPVINSLIALETGQAVDPAQAERDRGLAAAVLGFFDIRAIVVHPQAGPDIVPYVEATMPVVRLGEEGGRIAYRVELSPPPDRWVVEPGEALARLSYAEGWGIPANGLAWAQRRRVRLIVPLDGGAQRMSFRALAVGGGQRLVLEIDGEPAARLELKEGSHEYEVLLPASSVQAGLNEIWLRFETLAPAEGVRASSRAIGRTGVESPVNLAVQSAGEEVGDLAHIYVDGRDVSPNQRGYNVAAIDPASGALLEARSFDTHLDPQASQALAEFLDGLAPGTVVAVAVADEGSRLLGEEAVEALRGIGAGGDLRGRFRWGHAIIGARGAASGTAMEAMDRNRPVSLVAGDGMTEPHVAAAFSTITVEAQPAP